MLVEDERDKDLRLGNLEERAANGRETSLLEENEAYKDSRLGNVEERVVSRREDSPVLRMRFRIS